MHSTSNFMDRIIFEANSCPLCFTFVTTLKAPLNYTRWRGEGGRNPALGSYPALSGNTASVCVPVCVPVMIFKDEQLARQHGCNCFDRVEPSIVTERLVSHAQLVLQNC